MMAHTNQQIPEYRFFHRGYFGIISPGKKKLIPALTANWPQSRTVNNKMLPLRLQLKFHLQHTPS